MTAILAIYSLIAALIFFILGMMLIIAGKDNYTKIVIGIISAILSAIIFASISISLPNIVDGSINTMPVLILKSKTLIILLALTTLLSIFPIITLNPDWSKRKIINVILIPLLICGFLYIPFYTNIIKETNLISLHSFSGNINLVFNNISSPSVFIRFILLLFILIVPFVLSYASSLVHLSHKNRKPTINFIIYYISLYFLTIVIILYCLGLPYCDLALAIVLTSFISVLLVGYYRNASFLSKFIISPAESESEKEIDDNQTPNLKTNLSSVDTSFLDIWVRIDELTKVNDRFTNPDLQVQEIADEMKINVNLINDTLHRKGFNSYKEYLNSLRLIRFKELADKDDSAEITTLYEQAGFSSKSTFYRIFNLAEGITPSEYMNKLCKFHNM